MSAGIRALAHAAETIEPMLPRVRERLARTREGARALDHLTELHRGRPGPARAAFDRMCDRMVRLVLAAYGDEVAAHAERIERNLVALLDDLDHRRRGEAATRTARQRLADLEGLASASRQMRTSTSSCALLRRHQRARCSQGLGTTSTTSCGPRSPTSTSTR